MITKQQILESKEGKDLLISFADSLLQKSVNQNFSSEYTHTYIPKEYQLLRGELVVNGDKLIESFKQEQLKQEVDWEIISFKQDSEITDLWTYFPNHGWARNNNGHRETKAYVTLDAIMNNHIPDENNRKGIQYFIHSVKRKSDGVVFSLGDKVFYKDGTKFSTGEYFETIKSLNIHNNEIQVWFECSTFYFLSSLQKKTPLFKDFLGNKVFEGEIVYYCYLGNKPSLLEQVVLPYNKNSKPSENCFKNKSDAENYLINNAKVLSYDDIMIYLPTTMDDFHNPLKELIKSRLNIR